VLTIFSICCLKQSTQTTTNEVTMFKTISIYALIITIITFLANDTIAILDVLHLSLLIVLFSIYVPMIAHGLATEGNGK